MALIPVYHVVADSYPVASTVTAIPAGRIVGLDPTTGKVVLVTTTSVAPVGVAGDAIGTGAAGNGPYSADLTVTPATFTNVAGTLTVTGGAQRFTQDRVSDNYNETASSQLMTVYTAGGKFKTDQYVAAPSAGWVTYGAKLYVDIAGGTYKLTTDSGSNSVVVGILVAGPAAEPSGVPGTDVQGSTTLGNYITFILNVAN
jgi:hypothetical protein